MRKENAYMTVEAALVMSVVLMVYLFLIRYSLWIYDRCVLEQDMAMLLLRYSVSEEDVDWQQFCSTWDKEAYIWVTPGIPVLEKKGSTLLLMEKAEGGRLSDVSVQYELEQVSPIQWLRLKRKLGQNKESLEGENK